MEDRSLSDSPSQRFLDADAFVASDAIEGGISNRSSDAGGETAYGISRRYHPNETPWPPTPERARFLRWKGYWRESFCDDLPEPLDLAVYDWSINSGENNPALELQKLLGFSGARGSPRGLDGDIGPETALAAREACALPEAAIDLSRKLVIARAKYLTELIRNGAASPAGEDQLSNLGGWWKRTLLLMAELDDRYIDLIDSRPTPDLPELLPFHADESAEEGKMASPTPPEPRPASGPLEGAIRQGIRYVVALAVGWAATTLPWLVPPDAAPGLTETITLGIAGVVASGLAALGKLARDRGWPLIGSLL